MLTKEQFQSIIEKYDLTQTGYKREFYLKRIIPALKRKEIIILKGVRRCGKTTIMLQLIQELLGQGVELRDILYVNLDDFNFLPYLSIDLLEFILSIRNTKNRLHLFLDEIQKIPQFESWLRTQYDRGTNIKFIVSGSNSTLLAKDLATLLTGRNLTYEIFPLDYKECKEFGYDNLNNYITYGGFPEIVLEKNGDNKMNLLRNYVSDIINKDVILRRDVKDPRQLLLFAQFLLQNPGMRLSINRLSKQIGLSKDTVIKYLSYLVDAYLIFEVPFFSYSAKSKFIPGNVPKYYVLDPGFYIVNTPRIERSKLFETAIAIKLHKAKEVYYWKQKNEVDFVSGDNAFNVVSSETMPQRERVGLEELQKHFKYIKKSHIIGPSKISRDDMYIDLKTFLESP